MLAVTQPLRCGGVGYYQYAPPSVPPTLRTNLVLLCYKRRTQQKGQQGRLRSNDLATRMRSVAMEWGLCRSPRAARFPVGRKCG